MLDFYTLKETLKMVAESSNDKYTYTANDIATLCRAGKLTPFFSYNCYVAEKIEILHGNTGEYYEDFSPHTITPFNGYLTSRQLLDLLDGYRDSIIIEYAHNDKGHELQLVANNVVLGRLESEAYSPYSSDDAIKVTKEQLFFKREQVQNYIEELSEQLSQQTDKLANDHKQLSERTEKSYQTTIGLLLELMTTPKGIDDKAPFQSQATIIDDILDEDIQGQRKTTLENRFRDAKVMLADAKKKRPKLN